jgi:ABC-2 type transport system ATP-binding protein
MNLVEALCDRILLINKGRAVLYGDLHSIKGQYAPNTVRLRADDIPADLDGVVSMEPDDGAINLTLADDAGPQDLLRTLVDRGVHVREFEVAPVPLEDIFVSVVTGED